MVVALLYSPPLGYGHNQKELLDLLLNNQKELQLRRREGVEGSFAGRSVEMLLLPQAWMVAYSCTRVPVVVAAAAEMWTVV